MLITAGFLIPECEFLSFPPIANRFAVHHLPLCLNVATTIRNHTDIWRLWGLSCVSAATQKCDTHRRESVRRLPPPPPFVSAVIYPFTLWCLMWANLGGGSPNSPVKGNPRIINAFPQESKGVMCSWRREDEVNTLPPLMDCKPLYWCF